MCTLSHPAPSDEPMTVISLHCHIRTGTTPPVPPLYLTPLDRYQDDSRTRSLCLIIRKCLKWGEICFFNYINERPSLIKLTIVDSWQSAPILITGLNALWTPQILSWPVTVSRFITFFDAFRRLMTLDYCPTLSLAPTAFYVFPRLLPLLTALTTDSNLTLMITSRLRFGLLEITPLVGYHLIYLDYVRAVWHKTSVEWTAVLFLL